LGTFFPNDCLQEITTCTNIYLSKISDNYQRDKDVLDTDVDEIRALIGLLYIAGMLRNNHINLSDLWANDGFSPDIFRAVSLKDVFTFYFALYDLITYTLEINEKKLTIWHQLERFLMNS
jgi:hypothetical protein